LESGGRGRTIHYTPAGENEVSYGPRREMKPRKGSTKLGIMGGGPLPRTKVLHRGGTDRVIIEGKSTPKNPFVSIWCEMEGVFGRGFWPKQKQDAQGKYHGFPGSAGKSQGRRKN